MNSSFISCHMETLDILPKITLLELNKNISFLELPSDSTHSAKAFQTKILMLSN